jgi:hypothetical protein
VIDADTPRGCVPAGNLRRAAAAKKLTGDHAISSILLKPIAGSGKINWACGKHGGMVSKQ